MNHDSQLKGNCNDFFDFLFCTFSECYRSISNGGKVLLPQVKYPRSYWQLKLHTPEYFLLWVGLIDYVDHETEACGAAKITYANTVITMSESIGVSSGKAASATALPIFSCVPPSLVTGC